MKHSESELKEVSSDIKMPFYITINQASKMCGLPYTRIRKLIDDGMLEFFKAESRYYVDANDLKTTLKKSKQRKSEVLN